MSEKTSKAARLSAIGYLVNNHSVGSQDELMALLKDRGFAITQATLSRDLKELKVIKVPQADGYRYVVQEGAALRPVNLHANSGIRSIQVGGQFIVLKTMPGFASMVASMIDANIKADFIMGTLAGDDTVLVILKGVEYAERAYSVLASAIPGVGKIKISL